jgi:hypothetical protein
LLFSRQSVYDLAELVGESVKFGDPAGGRGDLIGIESPEVFVAAGCNQHAELSDQPVELNRLVTSPLRQIEINRVATPGGGCEVASKLIKTSCPSRANRSVK